jgi:hypothetical protein
LANKKYVQLFWKKLVKKSNVRYPNVDIIDNIAFVGLDSMAKELHWYDALFANGELGDTQLKRLGDILNRKWERRCYSLRSQSRREETKRDVGNYPLL